MVLPEGFDPEPRFVMRDFEERGEFWCDHCSICLPYRSQLHEHWRTVRHQTMVDFLLGEPMFYCGPCNVLPSMPFLHRDGRRQRRTVARLGRISQDSDVALRQVVMGVNRRVAILIPNSV